MRTAIRTAIRVIKEYVNKKRMNKSDKKYVNKTMRNMNNKIKTRNILIILICYINKYIATLLHLLFLPLSPPQLLYHNLMLPNKLVFTLSLTINFYYLLLSLSSLSSLLLFLLLPPSLSLLSSSKEIL